MIYLFDIVQLVSKAMFFMAGTWSACKWVKGNQSDEIKINLKFLLLAFLFWRSSWAIVIVRSTSSSFSCKNFNVTDCSKSIKVINTKLWILAHHDKVQLQDKEHNSESYSFRVMPLFTINFKNYDGPWQTNSWVFFTDSYTITVQTESRFS